MLIRVSRRSLLLGIPAAYPLLAQTKPATPMQTLGPFYPVDRPRDQDADLTVIKGKPGRAKGELLYVMGQVLDAKGQPVKNARLEVWQANAAGRYRHPGDDNNSVPIDPNFEGYALLTTDSEGRYKFKTVKPGSYKAGAGTRTPHIHFDVSGKQTRLTTQMYFPGEALNEQDMVYKETRHPELLVAKVLPATRDIEPEAKIAVWDVVLFQG